MTASDMVCLSKNTASYDSIAGLYSELWADWYLPAAMPALEQLFLSQVPRGSAVLDVCCGCAHVTQELVKQGYSVTGIDLSAELIAIARERCPGADFVVADARTFVTERRYDAALSTFDALNHILELSDLTEAFRRVREAVRPGGLFVFDVNLEEAYFADLRTWHTTVTDREASLVRGTFDLNANLARTDLIWFVRTDHDSLWERRTSSVYERCYPESEISDALREAGWSDIDCKPAGSLGVKGDIGFGRLFFSARANDK